MTISQFMPFFINRYICLSVFPSSFPSAFPSSVSFFPFPFLLFFSLYFHFSTFSLILVLTWPAKDDDMGRSVFHRWRDSCTVQNGTVSSSETASGLIPLLSEFTQPPVMYEHFLFLHSFIQILAF